MASQAVDDRDELLSRVREAVGRHLSGTGARVFLFGSFARGEERRSSDVDIAVWHDGSLAAGILARLRADLEESTIPRRVDVVDLSEAGESFRREVFREGLPWTD